MYRSGGPIAAVATHCSRQRRSRSRNNRFSERDSFYPPWLYNPAWFRVSLMIENASSEVFRVAEVEFTRNCEIHWLRSVVELPPEVVLVEEAFVEAVLPESEEAGCAW